MYPTGEYYHGFAILLAQHVRQRLHDSYEISVSNAPAQDVLTGAMDIIDAIARPPMSTQETYYVGLTQSDVAYYFLHGGHPIYATKHVARANVVAVARALPEYLHIYSAGPPTLGLTADHPYKLHAESWEALYLGALGSGTLITSINVLPIVGEPPFSVLGQDLTRLRESFWVARPLDGEPPAQSVGDEPSWGATLVSAAPTSVVAARLALRQGVLVGLTTAQQRHLTNVYSEFYQAHEIRYATAHGEPMVVPSIEIPALLVATRELPADVARAIADFFGIVDDSQPGVARAHLHSLLEQSEDPAPSFLNPEFLDHLHEAMVRYSAQRTTDLILPRHRAVTQLRPPTLGVEGALSVLFLLLFVLIARRLFVQLRQRGFMEVSPRITIPLALALCLFWFHACLYVVGNLEYRAYMQYETDTVSAFIQYSYADLLPMLIHYVASAFSREDLFPVSRSAQLVWMSIPFVLGLNLFAGAVHLVVPPSLRYLQSQLRGQITMELKQHIVICNWHQHSADVIRQLHEQARLAGRRPPMILVLTRDPATMTIPRVETRKSPTLGDHYVHVISVTPGQKAEDEEMVASVYVIGGDPKTIGALEHGRVWDASVVIVFPDEALEEPDSPTTITVLSIQRLIKEKGEVGTEQGPKVIVWCSNSNNVPLFLDERFNVTDVCSTEWAWRVICQATEVPHVSNIYRRLMTATEDTNEFYRLRMPLDFPDTTFREIQERVHQFNVSRAGPVSRSVGRKNTIMLVGFSRSADLSKEGLAINPEPEAVVRGGDFLILLTYRMDEEVRGAVLGFVGAASGK